MPSIKFRCTRCNVELEAKVEYGSNPLDDTELNFAITCPACGTPLDVKGKFSEPMVDIHKQLLTEYSDTMSKRIKRKMEKRLS